MSEIHERYNLVYSKNVDSFIIYKHTTFYSVEHKLRCFEKRSSVCIIEKYTGLEWHGNE